MPICASTLFMFYGGFVGTIAGSPLAMYGLFAMKRYKRISFILDLMMYEGTFEYVGELAINNRHYNHILLKREFELETSFHGDHGDKSFEPNFKFGWEEKKNMEFARDCYERVKYDYENCFLDGTTRVTRKFLYPTHKDFSIVGRDLPDRFVVEAFVEGSDIKPMLLRDKYFFLASSMGAYGLYGGIIYSLATF